MKIELNKIKVKDLVSGFREMDEKGVKAYNGKLDIRPPYQREFIYGEKRQQAVIRSILHNYPLNSMYWAIREDGTYEIIDGQQRTLSICRYISNRYDVDGLRFQNLSPNKRNALENYELTIYLCSGDKDEKLEWFKTINMAGMELTEQELRNAVYTGPYLSDAKRYFSKKGCPAYALGHDYLVGNPIRQDYLETVLKWVSKGDIEGYLSKHQYDKNASLLWRYFQDVIAWIEGTFPRKYNINRMRFMRGINWGALYEEYKDIIFDVDNLDKEITALMLDDEVTNKRGIYSYVLTQDPKYLSLRTFSDAMKIEAYEKQEGRCALCGKEFDFEDMEADHIIPWSQGGKTTPDNCQMLCRKCNREKSDK